MKNNPNCKSTVIHRSFWRRFIVIALAAVVTGMPLTPAFSAGSSNKDNAGAQTATEKTPNSYPPLLIGPGDELDIFVVNFSSGNGYTSGVNGGGGEKSQIPTDYMVDSDGMVLFPFLGKIQLKGLTQINAAELLRLKLKEYINNPQVTVLVRNSNYYNVSLLGDVAKPGKFLIRGEPTVFSMLAEAGGALPDAKLSDAVIIHGDTYKKEGINLNHFLMDRGSQEKPPVLYPGDILMIPKDQGLSVNDWAIIASIGASLAIIATQIH